MARRGGARFVKSGSGKLPGLGKQPKSGFTAKNFIANNPATAFARRTVNHTTVRAPRKLRGT